MSRARRVGVLLAAAAAGACLVPAAARAEAATGAEVRALAARAATDPGALARLRAIDRVDGRPADVRGALRGARGRELRARLRVLAAEPPGGRPLGLDPDEAARGILSERRFRGAAVPGPFHDLLERIGRWVRKLDRLFPWLDARIPGPRAVVLILISALVVALATFVARRTLTRRVRAASEAAAAAAPAADDPRALERRADTAEAAGDLEAALRLRFRAGLLRLDARGAIDFRPSISTHEVRRALRSPDFDALAATFDDVVYGGRPPEPTDVAAARQRWPAVVSAARHEKVAA